MVEKLPPYLASEIGARLRELDPLLGTAFDLPVVEMSGEQLEVLAGAFYLLGYGAGATEGTKGEIGAYVLEHHAR